MAIFQSQPQNQDQTQNNSMAPILGQSTGVLGQGVIPGQGQRSVSSGTKGSGRFTNLQSYIRANEPESGELNPNARLIQQRVGQAQTGAESGLGAFKTAQTEAQKGLEGIRERGQLVESAFKSPEEFIKQTPQLERFTALRTGTENIPTTQSLLSPLEQSQQQLQSTRQNLATGLQTDITGGGLQEYLKSQRTRPELATRGESQLDRFIAEQTPGGIAQLEAGRKQAETLQALQPESFASQQELASQIGQMPFISQSAIQNELNKKRQEQEQFLQTINPSYVQEKIGLSARTADPRFTDLEVAQYRQQSLDNYNQRIAENNSAMQNIGTNLNNSNQQINNTRNEINNLQARLERFNNIASSDRNPSIQFEGQVVNKNDERNKIQNEINNLQARLNNESTLRNDLQNQYNTIAGNTESLNRWYQTQDWSLQPKLAQYQQQLNLNRQQLLQQYDPSRLSRIQALGQLAGQGYEDILNRGII